MTTETLKAERAGKILGVAVTFPDVLKAGELVTRQTAKTNLVQLRPGERIRAEMRFDDHCGNGKMSFAITADIYDSRGVCIGGGCAHDDIAHAFPKLAPLIKWHLCDTAGPMHYLGNVTYHAGNRDHRGMVKGETRQLRNGRTGQPVWELVTRDESGAVVRPSAYSMQDSDAMPESKFTTAWEPRLIIGEGKERDLKAARSCAIWPDATDSELKADKATLTAALAARLPALVARFRAAMESDCGFVWIEKGAAQ